MASNAVGLAGRVLGASLVVGLAVGAWAPARAADPGNLTPEQIIQAAFERNLLGFTAGQANLRMEIKTSQGTLRLHDLEFLGLKSAEGLLRAIVRFRSPDEVAGTAFLMRQRLAGPPEQYIYLPKFQKVRTVTATQLYQKFLGSDFSYVDFTPIPTEPSQVKLVRLGDAVVDGQDSYVVEATPLVPGSPYATITAFVRKDVMVPVKLDFKGTDGKLLKVLSVKRIKVEGGKAIPLEVEMRNAVEGSQTLLRVDSVNFSVGLSDADFAADKLSGPPK
jgi:hypothetical protein